MIINIYFLLSIYMFMLGIITFVSNRKHLLSMLMTLEFIMLSLFYSLFMYLLYMNYELYFSVVFLTFVVCEGALGLSILVSMIRTHGNDYFQSFNIL